MMGGIILAAIIGYLLGSIPFGLVLTRFAGLGDIRQIGSGSIGATNVLRTGNKTVAALTLAFDVAKGAAAALIGAAWTMGMGLPTAIGVCIAIRGWRLMRTDSSPSDISSSEMPDSSSSSISFFTLRISIREPLEESWF